MTVARRAPLAGVDLAPQWNALVRTVAAVAAGVAIAVGAIALLRIDWGTAGLDAQGVSVAGTSYGPRMALVTLAAGLIALAAAVSPDRASKLFVGSLLVIAGIVILVADSTGGRWAIQEGHGWLAVVVGAVLVLAGVLLRPTAVGPPVGSRPLDAPLDDGPLD